MGRWVGIPTIKARRHECGKVRVGRSLAPAAARRKPAGAERTLLHAMRAHAMTTMRAGPGPGLLLERAFSFQQLGRGSLIRREFLKTLKYKAPLPASSIV